MAGVTQGLPYTGNSKFYCLHGYIVLVQNQKT